MAICPPWSVCGPLPPFLVVFFQGGIPWVPAPLSTKNASIPRLWFHRNQVFEPVQKLMLRHPALALSAATAAVIFTASACYWIVEQPFLRLKKRFEIARPASACIG